MDKLHKFSANQFGRDFVVGDIHGMYSYLMETLDDIGFDKSKDRLFSVGDLIDRGPESEKCLALCYEPWFFAVRGNHEAMMFDVLVDAKADGGLWFMNGGNWWFDCDQDGIRGAAIDLSERMPYGIEVETKSGNKIGIVHADVHFYVWNDNWTKFDNRVAQVMLWSRTRINRGAGLYVHGLDKLYVGHTPDVGKRVLENVHYIDTGAVFQDGYMYIEEIE